MDNIVTFQWIGTIVATAGITATVTTFINNTLSRRKNRNNNCDCSMHDEIAQMQGDIKTLLTKLEALPEKVDRSNELLAEIKGLLSRRS